MSSLREKSIAKIIWGDNIDHDLEGKIYRLLRVPNRKSALQILSLIEHHELKFVLDYVQTCMSKQEDEIVYDPEKLGECNKKLREFHENSILKNPDFLAFIYPIITRALQSLYPVYIRIESYEGRMEFIRIPY